MPDRIIRESICTSDTIDQLSWFEEVFWHRLTVNCDDYGRFDARAKILKNRLFPLKDGITEKQINAALNKLSTVGLVQVYEYDQKPYLQLVTWSKYQRTRAVKSKYPQPPDNICCQPSSNVPVSECENRESRDDILPGAETAPDPPIVELILNDKTFHPVYQVDIERWGELYPAVDVLSQLRSMAGWCEANTQKRKTKSGISRFINSWLSKEQNRGGNLSLVQGNKPQGRAWKSLD